jgi:hypothetical protein
MRGRKPVYPIARTTRGQQRVDGFHDSLRPDDVSKPKPRYGVIVKQVQIQDNTTQQYFMYVYVRFDEDLSKKARASYGKPIILGHQPAEVATLYGDDLVGLRCRIEFEGTRAERGVVYIDNPEGHGNLENMSSLPSISTFLAPPGRG